MYHVFIADDESIIREGLKCILDWETHGFSIAGEAADGETARKEILRLRPEVVLMDIRMPKMQGLDVIRLLREDGFSGKIIILSGYSDFKYAQQAIRYGVHDYLTKPINENELAAIIDTVRTLLDKDRSSMDKDQYYRRKARNTALHDILTGQADFSDPDDEFFRKVGVYQVVICDGYGSENDVSPSVFADLLHISNENLQSFETITVREHTVILLKGNFAVKRFEELLKRSQHGIEPEIGSALDSFFLTYGKSVPSLAELPVSYRQASELLERRFFCKEGGHIIGYTELPAQETGTFLPDRELLSDYAGKFVNYLQACNGSLISQTLDDLEAKLSSASGTAESIKLFLKDLYLRIKEDINHLYRYKDIPFPGNAEMLRLIDEAYYLYEILRFFREQFEMILSFVGGDGSTSVMNAVLHYIDRNYAENITLESIAPLFGYNSSYLGKLFNRKAGKCFNAYVDQMRIEQSKRLLRDENLKVYDVAKQVGYHNVDYFHIKFKKYVGQSPAEFRKSCGKK